MSDAAQIEYLIDINTVYGLELDWSGDNWPQPKLIAGAQTINWDEMRLEGPRPVSCAQSWDAIYESRIKPWADCLGIDTTPLGRS